MQLPVIKKPAAPVGRFKSEIETFVSLVQKGVDAWTQAGRALVVMMEKDRDLWQKIRKEHPEISFEMLSVFEGIGRKQIYAPLLADNSIAARKLLGLPYEMQVKYATESIEVLTELKGEHRKTTMKKLSDLSKPEVKMVFGTDCIHTIEQQAFRFPQKQVYSPTLPQATPFQKPTTIGYYTLSVDGNGVVQMIPCPPSEKAQWIRCQTNGTPYKSAVVLFYRS